MWKHKSATNDIRWWSSRWWKIVLGACWLIISCMRFENIRAVVARKTIKSLKESTWNTIKTVLKNWGLKEEVNYRINNLEGTLTFWNDSVIIMKEMVDLPSDPNFERFGSSEHTIAMIDEVSEISEKAVEVLFPVFVGEYTRHSRHPECL